MWMSEIGVSFSITGYNDRGADPTARAPYAEGTPQQKDGEEDKSALVIELLDRIKNGWTQHGAIKDAGEWIGTVHPVF